MVASNFGGIKLRHGECLNINDIHANYCSIYGSLHSVVGASISLCGLTKCLSNLSFIFWAKVVRS